MNGGGKSTSSGTSNSTTSSPYAPLLAQFTKAGLPIFQQLSSQIGEALRTGGVNANIPIINRSVDAAREGASTSMESTRQALARAGLGDSSFAQRILSEQGTSSGESISQIPTNAAASLIGAAPGVGSTAVSAGGIAAGADYSSQGQTTSTPSFWSQFLQGLQSTGQAFGAYYGAQN